MTVIAGFLISVENSSKTSLSNYIHTNTRASLVHNSHFLKRNYFIKILSGILLETVSDKDIFNDKDIS